MTISLQRSFEVISNKRLSYVEQGTYRHYHAAGLMVIWRSPAPYLWCTTKHYKVLTSAIRLHYQFYQEPTGAKRLTGYYAHLSGRVLM